MPENPAKVLIMNIIKFHDLKAGSVYFEYNLSTPANHNQILKNPTVNEFGWILKKRVDLFNMIVL